MSSPPEPDTGTRLKVIRAPGTPAPPKNNAYSDQPNAASTPTLINVSIVAVACRAFAQAARWNGHAPQTTTGAANVRLSHCQLSNCNGDTMASTRTGSVSTEEIVSRCRSGRTSASSPSFRRSVISGGDVGRGGSGSRAV